MTNKYWTKETNKNGKDLYVLYFEPFGNTEELIRFSQNADGFVYQSELLKVEYDYLDCYSNDIEEAKQVCEGYIESYYEEYIEYYKFLLERFKEN